MVKFAQRKRNAFNQLVLYLYFILSLGLFFYLIVDALLYTECASSMMPFPSSYTVIDIDLDIKKQTIYKIFSQSTIQFENINLNSTQGWKIEVEIDKEDLETGLNSAKELGNQKTKIALVCVGLFVFFYILGSID